MALRKRARSRKRSIRNLRREPPERPWPSLLRSTAERVLDALSGASVEQPRAVACGYCGAVAQSLYLCSSEHGPDGCVLRADEDNLGTVLALGLRALMENDMIDNNSLTTEIKATDGNGNSLVFRSEAHADASTRRGRAEAVAAGTVPRCTVTVNGQDVSLDARVFEGWARNALNTLDSDY